MSEPSADVDLIPLAVLESYLELTRKINVLMREEEVMQVFVDMYQRTFPDMMHCIRLVDPARAILVHVLADGPLDPTSRERAFLAASSFRNGRVPDAVLKGASERLEILEEAPLVFEGTRGGVSMALTDESTYFGTVHLESAEPFELDALQRLMFEGLGNHLTGAIRSATNLKETTYLRDHLSKLIDSANAPIVIIDGRRRIQTFNRQLERLTGYTKKALVGTDFLELFEEKDRKRFVPVIIKAMKGTPTSNFETRIPRKRGGEAQIAFNITSVLDAYGKVEAVIAVGQDLTEIRRLQNQMLHSERLMTIGELSAGVVHEINNPLTSISVYSEYLLKQAQEDGASPDKIKRLQRIHDSARRIFQFTQQLIAYAKPTGEEPTLVDVAEVLNKSLGFCEHVIRKANVTVMREFGQDMPPVYGIEGQLEQIFVNLITNACHAMQSKKGGTLTLKVDKGQEGTLSIQVIDDGGGIPADIVKDIFEPFYTTKSEGEGTGLGLSIVKNIITNHEGDISVRSTPGEGTTFTVTLYASE